MRDPNFFAVIKFLPIPANIYPTLPTLPNLHIIHFTARDLANPSYDPIGVFFGAGNRYYLWQDKYWAEVNLSRSILKIMDRSSMLYGMFSSYFVSSGPTIIDNIDNPGSQHKNFFRVLYEIPNGPVI
jgi:hypothetical protein